MMDQRKQILINPHFQWRFLAFVFGLNLVIGVSTYLGHSYFMSELVEFGQHMNFPEGHPFYKHLGELTSTMKTVLGATMLLNGILVLSVGMVVSNKIAGPLYRMGKEFKNFKQNKKVEKIFPREGDYFQDVFNSFNELQEANLFNSEEKKGPQEVKDDEFKKAA